MLHIRITNNFNLESFGLIYFSLLQFLLSDSGVEVPSEKENKTFLKALLKMVAINDDSWCYCTDCILGTTWVAV
jgi:hypothetical protein